MRQVWHIRFKFCLHYASLAVQDKAPAICTCSKAPQLREKINAVEKARSDQFLLFSAIGLTIKPKCSTNMPERWDLQIPQNLLPVFLRATWELAGPLRSQDQGTKFHMLCLRDNLTLGILVEVLLDGRKPNSIRLKIQIPLGYTEIAKNKPLQQSGITEVSSFQGKKVP